jgi:UPF0755 protein
MVSTLSRTKIVITSAKFVLNLLINLVFYILLVLVVIKLSTAAYDFAYQVYGKVSVEAAPGKDVKFQIKQGEATLDIAKKLERNKIILNKYSFFLRAKITITSETPLLPGTYTLNTSMTYTDIIYRLTGVTTGEEEDQAGTS